jgi:hypothetical protein
MPTQVQLRRGTSAQNNSFTGASGELSVDTDNYSIRVHDGATAGGYAVAKRDLSNVSNVGVFTATSIVVSGNVSIGGTLTYEDVNNVDSIGVITARNGINVLAGGINAVGVITATSFVGNGSQLTGIDATAIQTGTTKVQTNAARVDTIISGSTIVSVNSGGMSVTGITTSTDFNSSSDINLKTNIQTIENPIDKLLEINGVTFNWIENERASVGVIAQDVEKVLPQLVNDMGAHKTVNYNGLIGLLVECIKHQQKQIDELKEHMIGS